jgi:hypothetical protein
MRSAAQSVPNHTAGVEKTIADAKNLVADASNLIADAENLVADASILSADASILSADARILFADANILSADAAILVADAEIVVADTKDPIADALHARASLDTKGRPSASAAFRQRRPSTKSPSPKAPSAKWPSGEAGPRQSRPPRSGRSRRPLLDGARATNCQRTSEKPSSSKCGSNENASATLRCLIVTKDTASTRLTSCLFRSSNRSSPAW